MQDNKRTIAGLITLTTASVLLTACGAEPEAEAPTKPDAIAQAPEAPAADPAAQAEGTGALSDDELLAVAPGNAGLADPVSFEDAKRPLSLDVFSERGYEDENGRLILDLMERDYLYLALLIVDDDGRPVRGARPTISPQGDSRLVRMAGPEDVSDDAGSYRFGIIGGQMGEERVAIALGDASHEVFLNVISLQAAGYSSLSDIEGALDWNELMQAKIDWGEQLSASFPPAVAEQHGKTVKLAGFMMPLTMSTEQEHFVMTSNPPSCFFHIPGGPAGAVEVFAKKPVKVGWDPIVLEGRFETLESSEVGTVYRLRDATVVQP